MSSNAPPPTDDDIHLEPQDALRQLIESEGYALLIAHIRDQWGNAAVLRKIRAALEENAATEHSTLTQSLLKTADDVIKAVTWPEEEYERLRIAGGRQKAPDDRFAPLRRTQ